MTELADTPNVAGQRRAALGDPLFEYLLRMGDDRLILGHRLSEWCGHAPILEEDIALANISLDLIGQANILLGLAGEADVKKRTADELAYFREGTEFRNSLIVELPRGDFGFTIMRQFLFDSFSALHLEQLKSCENESLSSFALKAGKEVRYHLRHSSEWVVRLGDGTEESNERVQRALNSIWRYTGELLSPDSVDDAAVGFGVRIDWSALKQSWDHLTNDVFGRAGLSVVPNTPMTSGGRTGRHTEHIGHLLSVMQSVARAHPGASW